MIIDRMAKGNWGKVRAFFDLKTDEGIVIKGFKLVEHEDNMFVGMPSQKDKEGEYRDTVWAEAPLKDTIETLALAHYHGSVDARGGQDTAPAPLPDDDDNPF